MKKFLIGTAVAGGAAIALVHCRDMMHNHGHAIRNSTSNNLRQGRLRR